MIHNELQQTLDSILHLLNDGQLQSVQDLTKLLQTVIKLLKGLKEELDCKNKLCKLARFSLRRFEGSDDDIRFWTGFYSYDSLIVFYDHVCKHQVNSLKYWMTSNSSEEHEAKHGPKSRIDPIDQMFLTLIKLKLGSANRDIAERFNISDSYVTRIFITWINFMYHTFEGTNIWMTKGKVRKYMPSTSSIKPVKTILRFYGFKSTILECH